LGKTSAAVGNHTKCNHHKNTYNNRNNNNNKCNTSNLTKIIRKQESRHPPSGFGQPSLPSALTLQPNINPPYNLPSVDYLDMSKIMTGPSISNPDSINENVITENSSLPNNSFGYVGYYSAETARSRRYDDRWYSKLGNICCFPSQNCNIISYIKELKNVMTKPPLYRYVFMFVPLNIIHGVAFGIILFPARDRYDNSNQKLFGAYKYVGMMMFFTR
ncbi:4361_t:CDS:2, partial [Entrophospora sp. SA101]